MKYIADLHIHSHYSLATSPRLNPEFLDYWARVKGIKVIGTGDFTHPGWVEELQEKLEPAEQGLFKLKPQYKLSQDARELLPASPETEPRFMLSAEISNIYKKGEKTRKIHNVVFAPDFEAVEKIQQSILNIDGNITSDGRPILGLDARDLLEIVLEASEECFFVPAHIWTPWFSALGDKSGFDSIQKCYRDLTDHIHAVETGLSTDAPMHWMCKFLDDFTLISNSDAHSPQKLGRNANILDTELSYDSICSAIASGNPDQFLGTIDLYPQNGKYYYDGHRKCNIRWNPVQTLKNDKICPECGKEVTVGVMNRVVELSDRTNLQERPNRLPFHSIIQLKEILSEIEDVGPKTKTVARRYNKLISKLGNELDILLNISIDQIEERGSSILAEAIKRMRNREVFIQEGYDGEYGEITVFKPGEIQKLQSGRKIFDNKIKEERLKYKSQNLLNFSLEKYRKLEKHDKTNIEQKKEEKLQTLNPSQKKAVTYTDSHELIKAGPGTGKTLTLTHKIQYLIENTLSEPKNILAITFTNKAAREIQHRLDDMIENNDEITIATFHKFGRQILEENTDKTQYNSNFTLINNSDRIFILTNIFEIKTSLAKKYSQNISRKKRHLPLKNKSQLSDFSTLFNRYEEYKQNNNLIDLADLLKIPYELLESSKSLLNKYQTSLNWILVDEYQDINNIQYDLIQLLVNPGHDFPKLCAIGDPHQAIYGFRGAQVDFINNFEDDFDDSKIIQFEKSYRCTNQILEAAQELIDHDQSSKHLVGQKEGNNVKLLSNPTGKSESEMVGRIIEKRVGGVRFFSIDSDITQGNENQETSTPGDYAVLCRTKQQISDLKEAFDNHGLPYQTISDTPFLEKKPLNQLLDILKLGLNSKNDLLRRKVLQENESTPTDLNKIISNQEPEKTIENISKLILSESNQQYERRIKRLISLASNFSTLNSFLKEIVLYSGRDLIEKNTENISILTMHSAKGLEFENVFIVGCEEKLLPYSLFGKNSDIAEEKRLLYVGMTRAKTNLFLSYANSRYISGIQYEVNPSPFINKINQKLERLKREPKSNEQEKSDRQLNLF